MKFGVWIICVFVLPAVVLAGPTSAPRKSQFDKSLNVIIASTIPDVFTDARESLIDRYLDGKPNKALAVQPVYRKYFRSELHEDQTVAGDRTLEACQLRFAKPCALIAVNEDIGAEGQLIYKDMPRLLYSGKFDLSLIPIITLATRNRADVQSYWGASEPKAIAIHPWGNLFIATRSGSSN
jgi:hypothetical protein